MLNLPKISTSSPTLGLMLTLLAGCAAFPDVNSAPVIAADCQSPGPVQSRVTEDRAANFTSRPTRTPKDMARDLVTCLGAQDPFIRDKVAYEGLTTLLRHQDLSPGDMGEIKDQLLRDLDSDDPPGVLRPFAALMLSEIIRADRVAPYLDDEERGAILDAGIAYFTHLEDYRGFDPVDGWRHGIAHTADLFMQISLNPAFGRDDHLKILDALAVQITTTKHAYTHGEGERMARPVLFIARAGSLSNAQWENWFSTLVAPAPLDSWSEAFISRQALIRLHNLKYTLYPLALSASDQPDGIVLLPGLSEAIARLP